MKALVLDFDGVVSDSAPEAFRVALRTYTERNPNSSLGAMAKAALYRAFLELMPLGNRAEDFGVALAAIEAGRELPDQAAYDAFYRERDRAELRAFHRRFYKVRAAFAREAPEEWRALLAPYPKFLATLRRRAHEVELAIATAKDRHSVRELLEGYGIDDLFPEDRVLDKETGVSKAVHLTHLKQNLGLEYPEMTFVDDKVNHLDVVAPLGVRCALACWGYNGPREHALARARGYVVCALDDVERKLFA